MCEYIVTKCHGSGNDFLLIDLLGKENSIEDEKWAEVATTLCNRQSGIGADGILLVLSSEKADARMRVFNADGFEASMCGNGLRCVARYVTEKLNKNELSIETMHTDLATASRIIGGVTEYEVEISPISFNPKDLPMNTEMEQVINVQIPELDKDLTFTALAVPNPHLITIVSDKIDSNQQATLAQKVNESNPWFPDGVNVSFVLKLASGEIFVQTFERGVGFTNACGTAMAASSLVTQKLGIHDGLNHILVYSPGGVRVSCTLEKNKIFLCGNATYEFCSTLNYIHEENSWNLSNTVHFEKEKEQYKAFQETVREKYQLDKLVTQ